MKNRSKFLIFKGDDGKWYFHLQANNNEIICQSEGYETQAAAINGVKAVKKSADAKILMEQE